MICSGLGRFVGLAGALEITSIQADHRDIRARERK
jgi:hypothetical protein